jgi:hypothetical protein
MKRDDWMTIKRCCVNDYSVNFIRLLPFNFALNFAIRKVYDGLKSNRIPLLFACANSVNLLGEHIGTRMQNTGTLLTTN